MIRWASVGRGVEGKGIYIQGEREREKNILLMFAQEYSPSGNGRTKQEKKSGSVTKFSADGSFMLHLCSAAAVVVAVFLSHK